MYGPELRDALAVVWEASDRLCGKRLAPFMAEFTDRLVEHGELTVSNEVREQLRSVSASTIDRLLSRYKDSGLRRPFSTTKPGSLLKASIPIRTFAEWEESGPGFIEVDLVAHCGDTTEGFYLKTLCGGHSDWLGGVPGGVGQGTAEGGWSGAQDVPFPAVPAPGPRLRQWL